MADKTEEIMTAIEQRKAIVIHGAQGVGKTALARSLFDGVTQIIGPCDLEVGFNSRMVCDTLFIAAELGYRDLWHRRDELKRIIKDNKMLINRKFHSPVMHDTPSRVIIELGGGVGVPDWLRDSRHFFCVEIPSN